jgi:hypothetical protein
MERPSLPVSPKAPWGPSGPMGPGQALKPARRIKILRMKVKIRFIPNFFCAKALGGLIAIIFKTFLVFFWPELLDYLLL